MKTPPQEPWTQALQSHWGFDALRPHQDGPVRALCAGQDVLAVLPTGGGKSLCYQLPGLVRGGVTLVISPLIALMQDQASDLKSRGLRVWNLGGIATQHELNDILDSAERSQPCFVFTSPERLENASVVERLAYLNIQTVAIDEAHCISEWGHDFRPSYRKIASLRDHLPQAAWGAFTATATPQVVEDIRCQLALEKPELFRHSSRRENLSFAVCQSRDPEAMLIRAVQHAAGCGIVYAGTRYQTEKWADRLKHLIPNVAHYHAGLSKDVRQQRLQDWLDNKIRVMVCTNAFGMGIDKPDVRWVFHAALPANLESYIQEAGRAGRDGKLSECVVFTHPRAIQIQRDKILGSDPSELPVREVYQAIANHGGVAIGSHPTSSTAFDLHAMEEQLGVSSGNINRCVLLLQQAGYFGAAQDASGGALLIALSAHAQTDLQELEPKGPQEARLLQRLANMAGNGKATWHLAALEAEGFEEAQVLESLNRLQTWGLVRFKRWNSIKHIAWKQPRQATAHVVVPEEFTVLSFQRALKGWESFEGYLDAAECRQLLVSRYFGFEDSDSCGSCDVCRIEALDETLPNWLASIPETGSLIEEVLNALPASRYSVFFEGVKRALDAGEIWMDGPMVFKA